MGKQDTILHRIDVAKETNAKKFLINNEELTQLPSQLFEINSLEVLEINNTQLTTIGDEISKLTNLKEAIFNRNQRLNNISSQISLLKNLNNFSIIDSDITEFPTGLFECKKISDINISSSKITSIPKQISELSELKSFWLYGTPVTELPLTKKQFENLLYLGIGDTKISDYEFLEFLKKIESLQIGNEEFSHLEKLGSLSTLNLLSLFYIRQPLDPIYKLKNLEFLYIADSITDVTSDIRNLSKLKVLDIRGTELPTLPSEICEITELNQIRLSDNNLKFLPPELSKLPKLTDLTIFDNDSVISPPKSVIQEGTKSIIAYLAELLHSQKVWASKLVVVGEGGMGKSCLIDALLDKPFKAGSNTTHGISIRQMSCNHPIAGNSCEMTLNIWDFGGQDIYHATHQFYLTNHSLFILVWSARLGYDTGKIYKWLEIITALAPDSPIFIVATNSGPRGADLPKGDIETQFKSNIHFFEVDNKTKEGINELKAAIIDIAPSLKYMGVERPQSWINAKEAIAQLKRKHAAKNEIVVKLHECGVLHDSTESLLRYLHDLGDILYYPDDATLKDTIILKPAWVSKQIAKILDSKQVSDNAGFLTHELIQTLWKDIDASMHEKLLMLMEKFDLSYKTKDDKEISLIVEKLKFEEPREYEKTWAEFYAQNTISFKYSLDTIPPGIPTWFIARTHRFSTKIHWRYGVLLQNENKKNMGLVLTSPERKEVWLHVKGAMPYYFFSQLRDTLELTYNRFEGLKVTTNVPCPGHNGRKCNHFFDLRQLEKRLSIKSPKATIECPESMEEVNVMQMLFGISFAPENNALVERITAEVKNIIREENTIQSDELKKFICLEFIKMYRKQQEIMDITCPNTFILLEKNLEGLEVDLMYKHYSLQLCCQMPGCNHIAGEPYTVKMPREWLEIIGPYYNKMMRFLKLALPVIIPGIKELIEKTEYENINTPLEITKEGAGVFEFEVSTAYESYDDAPIRLIRQLLDSVDPKQHWSGLQRLVSPEGHILWLCQNHYNEYTDND